MERDRSIDIAKGIAILLVVVGHSHCVTGVAHQIIYSFHMPLFFILAGWFYKERAVKDSFTRDFRRLIVPYLFFEVLCALKFAATGSIQHDWQNARDTFIGWATNGRHDGLIWGTMPSSGILWFLPALYWCKNIYNGLNVTFKKKTVLLVSVSLVSIVATLLDRYVINIPFGILPGCGAMIFFAIGLLLREQKLSMWLWVAGICCWCYSILFSELVMGNSHYGMYPVDVLGATIATMSVCKFSQMLQNKCSQISSFLSWCGMNSMIIYCMHYIVMIIDPNTRMGIHDWYIWLAIDFGMILPLSYLCTRINLAKRLFMIR